MRLVVGVILTEVGVTVDDPLRDGEVAEVRLEDTVLYELSFSRSRRIDRSLSPTHPSSAPSSSHRG